MSKKQEADFKQKPSPIFETVANEVARPARKRFPTRKVIATYPDNVWSADLVQLTAFKEQNNGFEYILNVVDCFSRFAWAVPLKQKKATEVLNAFKEIVKQNNGKNPKLLWVDEGSEFYNKQMKDWCKSNDLTMYSTHGAHKSAVVERFNRTIKTKMWRQFIAKNTRNWLSLLPGLMKDYNSTKHSSIKMTPNDAKKLNSTEVAELNDDSSSKLDAKKVAKPEFKVGDYVRISRQKNVFEKGYENPWSMEIFKIIKVHDTTPYTYSIEDTKGDPITGSFYEQELQHTAQNPSSEFLVEKVLDRRTVKGKKQVLVKWLGYSDAFNSWIDA